MEWQRKRQLINRAAALGPTDIDLNYYDSLPPNHPVKAALSMTIGLDSSLLRAQMRHIEEAPGAILESEVDTAQLLSKQELIRRKVFKQLLCGIPPSEQDDNYKRTWRGAVTLSKDEVTKAMEYLAPLFFEPGQTWRDKWNAANEGKEGVPYDFYQG